ncbi:MAG: sigma-70 family RNA polymerase sigma factor [Gemmatimonadales bacterium]
MDSTHRVTALLQEMAAGREAAAEELVPLIYAELHRMAERQMRGERDEHTLQPTALVHEAFLRLLGQNATWQNRSHFFGVASQAMRRILVDHARRQKARKRGAGAERVTLDDNFGVDPTDPDAIDLEALDVALKKLAELESRHARVVELRYFGGLSVEETAEVLGTSAATVKRDWQFAKAWLSKELEAMG